MSRRAQSARAAGTISAAVLLSRLLGVVREQVYAHLFGAGIYSDAWRVAFRIPNLLRDLFAEGALSSAFVPTFTDYHQNRGKEQAWILANTLLSVLLVLLGGFALLLLAFPRVFVYLLAWGFMETPGKFDVTVRLLQILSPFLLCVTVAAVFMGMLNTLNHYFLPALAPALFNLANILAGVFLAPWFEKWGILSIHAMAVGALAGGILQFAVQAPLLRRYGFRFRVRLDLRHEGLRRVGRLIAPAVIGISAVQINVLVSTQLASSLGYDGPISWLEYAFRLIYLPIGLFGVAVGVVNLREVSAYSAQKQWEELKETVANSIKLVTLLAMPSAVGLTILSRSIVRVLYEHGHFTASDTEWTALALAVYSAGLIGYSCIKVYVPTFYALNDTATPVRISIGCVGFSVLSNLALVAVLPRDYKYLGLAATTAVAALLNSLLLSRSFNKRLGTLERFKLKSALLRTGAAALAMGLVVFAASRYGALIWPDPSLVEEGVLLAVTMGGGMAVYFSACLLLKVEEASLVVRRFRR